MDLSECATLSFEEWRELLVDSEMTAHDNARLASRLKRANLRLTTTVEDIDFRSPRGLTEPPYSPWPSARGPDASAHRLSTVQEVPPQASDTAYSCLPGNP
ncbi:MAG: ATP-binding protein [Candidatus Hydrogenedentes bacterium]|nr:ATP-binding protein [Candidatus Hydrogenedentota bacterium]